MDRKKKSKLFWQIKKKTDGILEWVVRKLLISHSQFLKCWGRTTETLVNVGFQAGSKLFNKKTAAMILTCKE